MNETHACTTVPTPIVPMTVPSIFHIQFLYKLFLISLLTTSFMPFAFAEHKALWEFGLGAGIVHAPLYRGAIQTNDYSVPIPFVRYRGKIFAADEDGMRGLLYRYGKVEIDVSFAGSLPVSKSEDGPRQGMPSLDPILQFGPAVNYLLSQSVTRNTKSKVSLELPFRGVFSFGNPTVAHRGWVISPSLDWVYQYRDNGTRWRLSLSAGPLFSNTKFNNYFYQVEPQYENTQRLKYNAHSGYSGSRITIRFSRNSRQFFFGFFARFDSLKNATFDDSPLVETEQYGLYGIAAAWIISKSDKRAQHWK